MEDSKDLNSQTLNLSKGRADRRARFQVCATSTPRDPVSGNDVVRFLFQALPASFDIDDPDDSSFNVLLSITTIAQRLYSPESEVLAITKSLWTTICAQSSRLVQGFIISSEKRPTTAVGYLFRERLLATMVLLLCGLEHIASIHSVQEYRALLSLAPLFLPLMVELVFSFLGADGDPHFEFLWAIVSKFRSSRPGSTQLGSPVMQQLLAKYNVPDLSMWTLDKEVNKPIHLIDGAIVLGALDLISVCHVPQYDKFRHTMLSRKVVTLLVLTLKRFVTLHPFNPTVEDTELICAVVSQCYQQLEKRFYEGFSWIVEALDNQLLSLFPQVAATLEKAETVCPGKASDIVVDAFISILSFMKPFLIFRSVLNRVLREMKTLEGSGVFKRLSKFPRVEAALRDFDAEAWKMKCLMYQFDDHNVDSCMSPRCLKKPKHKAVKYKRCSRCYAATYCSKSCQIFDWKHGPHQEMCEEFWKPSKGCSYNPSKHDEMFIKFLARRDIRSRQDQLTKDTLGAAKSRSTVLAQYDFSKWPMEFTQIRVASVKEKQICTCGALQGCPVQDALISQRKLLNPRKQVLVRVIVPPTFFCEDRWVYREEIG